MTVSRYINEEGKVGVLISGGYGAGWSTWAQDKEREFLLFDRGLVALALAKEEAYKGLLESKGSPVVFENVIDKSYRDMEEYLDANNCDSYTGGWDGVSVTWMDPGTEFIVEEYDGSESLRYRNNEDWVSA